MAQQQQLCINKEEIIAQILDKFNDRTLYEFAKRIHNYFLTINWAWKPSKVPEPPEIVDNINHLLLELLRELIKANPADIGSLGIEISSGGIFVKGAVINDASFEYCVSIGFQDTLDLYITSDDSYLIKHFREENKEA